MLTSCSGAVSLRDHRHDLLEAVGERVAQIQKTLPPGVKLETIYDRSDFVGRTLSTVMRNLAEGIGIVTLVLCLFLGSWRGAVAVVLGIPVAMTKSAGMMVPTYNAANHRGDIRPRTRECRRVVRSSTGVRLKHQVQVIRALYFSAHPGGMCEVEIRASNRGGSTS